MVSQNTTIEAVRSMRVKIAYIILAHKNPLQLARLVNRLSSEHSAFFIHIDKKVNIAGFESALLSCKANQIKLIHSENTRWGSIGMVKAMLNGIKDILKAEINFDYIIFLSGQCYPIKNVEYIHRFLESNKETTFVRYMKLPNKSLGKEDGGLYRVKNYHYQNFKNRNLNKIINRCLKYSSVILPTRHTPYYIKNHYSGETWMSFPINIAEYIINFIDINKDYLEFHKYSYCPDEMFIHTILLNSNDDKILSNLKNETLTYIDWSKPYPNRPAIMRCIDFNSLLKSDKLFARKFDMFIDNDILDIIDRKILLANQNFSRHGTSK